MLFGCFSTSSGSSLVAGIALGALACLALPNGRAGANVVGFSGSGTGATQWSMPSNSAGGIVSAMSNNVLEITSGQYGNESTAAWYNTTQDISGPWTAKFTYQNANGGGADGITFTVQADSRGTAAIGDGGNDLGYANNNNGTPANVSPSVAYAMEIYNNADEGGFGLNGSINGLGNTTQPYVSISPINPDLTDPINFTIMYSGATHTLSVSLVQALNNNATYATSETIDIPTILGTSLGQGLGYIGFTGGTGGATTTQDISNFSFTNVVPEPAPLALLAVGAACLLLLKRRKAM